MLVLATGLNRTYFEDVSPPPSIFIFLCLSLCLVFLFFYLSVFSYPYPLSLLSFSFSSSSCRSSLLTGQDVTLTSSVTFAVCALAGEGAIIEGFVIMGGAWDPGFRHYRLSAWVCCAIGWLCDYVSYLSSLGSLSSFMNRDNVVACLVGLL